MKDWIETQIKEFDGEIRFDEPLHRHTYFKIGGPADVLAIPRTIADLERLSKIVTKLPYFILGRGSNLLAADKGFRGLVVKTLRLDLGVELKNETELGVGASVGNSTLLGKAAHKGWAGLEFLTGVPGAVGGAVFMNAGTHIGETKDAISAVEYFSLKTPGHGVVRLTGDQLKFAYRKNLCLPAGAVVLRVEWRVEREDPKRVKMRIDEMLLRRKKSQPVDFPSCGSVFKNPKAAKMHAWQVVDQVGLRGHRIGQAQFSEKHANFILNHGSALGQDVKALIDLAKIRAKKDLGILLEEEVRYLGF